MTITEFNLCVAKLIDYIITNNDYYNPEIVNVFIADDKVYIKTKNAKCYYITNKYYDVWTEEIEE